MNGGDLFIFYFFFLVSTSVVFVLISEFECSQDLSDVIDSAVNSTTFFTVSPSTVYNGVTWSRAACGSGLSR